MVMVGCVDFTLALTKNGNMIVRVIGMKPIGMLCHKKIHRNFLEKNDERLTDIF